MNFFRYICRYFHYKRNMKNLQDLQNALDTLTTQAQTNADSSVAVLTAANDAATRVANLPAAIDYTAQVDQVNAITTSLQAAVVNINQATSVANGILP